MHALINTTRGWPCESPFKNSACWMVRSQYWLIHAVVHSITGGNLGSSIVAWTRGGMTCITKCWQRSPFCHHVNTQKGRHTESAFRDTWCTSSDYSNTKCTVNTFQLIWNINCKKRAIMTTTIVHNIHCTVQATKKVVFEWRWFLNRGWN
jgi:hypothetical protein